MRITDLGGHSGCKILLCEDEGRTFVRKVSSSIDYNRRLEIQAKKQNAFYSQTVKTPRVLSNGYDGKGLFYFDMEYIQGITLSAYIKTIEIGKIRFFVDSLVDSLVDIESGKAAETEKFASKISSLKEKLASHNNPIIDEALAMLAAHSWNNFEQTQCHGDLTLENILIKDNQIYLIDFLDSFYDSWIMDISTLMQDVQTMWSYRKEKTDINTVIRLIIFRDILMDRVKKVAGDFYIEVYYALLLKLVRIYPYTADELTYNFLNEKTRSIMDIIKTEEVR